PRGTRPPGAPDPGRPATRHPGPTARGRGSIGADRLGPGSGDAACPDSGGSSGEAVAPHHA
ncbi:hypothetical protein, partial [Actinomadura fibrosa]|uniref:hypothetical protein n=1 Tax=Actinomadura fibrosa TaxID=111802 RepID=UPI001A954695